MDPVEILDKLRELKRREVNLTSHSVRKQLYNMKYIIGKAKAGEFCEHFEEVVRNYESSQGATPLSEGEKRDAFYNAVMVSVPQVQTVELVCKNSNGVGLTYDQLKVIVMQDEATRSQASGATAEVRTANLAQADTIRC